MMLESALRVQELMRERERSAMRQMDAATVHVNVLHRLNRAKQFSASELVTLRLAVIAADRAGKWYTQAWQDLSRATAYVQGLTMRRP
jgi:hypothetical protein